MVDKYLIQDKTSIKKTIQKIDVAASKTLFVTNEKNK